MIAVRNKLSVLGHKMMMVFLSLPVLILTGCSIWEDLPECPPTTGKVWIGLSFTYHNTTDENKNYIDLFGETARRTDLFIFNEDDLLIKKIEDATGPFVNGYRIPVEQLPAGTYHAVAWCNLYSNGATVLSPEPVEGKTKKEELTVQLSELENNEITRHSLPLLYGKTEPFTVSENDLTRAGDTVIPISLLRNTNEINIMVKWVDANTGKPCRDASHAESTRIYIRDNNGMYNLDNEQQTVDAFTYIPSYLTNLPVNEEEEDATLHAKSTVMRMFPDSSPQLQICNVLPDGKEEVVYNADLMADFIGKLYNTQEKIDRCPSFDIEITFECYSWVAVDIVVNGWQLEDSGDVDIQ